MPPGLIVFDLDGTLIDSRSDLCDSVNATLAYLGKPALSQETIASYVGDGADVLVRRALNDPEANLPEALAFFLDFYRVHKLDATYVYPGVFEALKTLRASYPFVPMAVLTNKPVIPSREICAHFKLNPYFFQNYGGNSFTTKKPNSEGLLTLIAEASTLNGHVHAIDPAQTVLIGDSDIDILTARNSGARSIGCTFGLAPDTLAQVQPDLLVHSAAEWPDAVDQLFRSSEERKILC